MRRNALLTVAMVVLVSSASAIRAQVPPQAAQAPGASAQTPAANAQAPARPRRVMPRPTNLQVLPKDISTDDLMKLMRGYAADLGVHCTFCHAVNDQTHRPDFASDAKPEKASARVMIVMMREINTKYMSQIQDPDATPAIRTVTCGTCHRGMSTPEPFVPAPESRPDSKPETRPESK